MADLKKLAEEIVGLTLLEASELKKILKDEYGIEPAAGAVAVAAGPAAGPAEVAEEQTEFDVILKAAGAKKINVIKEVREGRSADGKPPDRTHRRPLRRLRSRCASHP